MTHDTKLIDKIKAILRKAQESNNPSDEERDTAMRMANRLLLKHGMTMQDVGTIDDDDTPAGREYEHEIGYTFEGNKDRWKGTLLNLIAPVYFCKIYRLGGTKHVMLIGRGDYAMACRTMFDFIVPQVEREFAVATSKLTQHRRYARRYALHALEGAEVYDMTDEEIAEAGAERWQRTVNEIGVEGALTEIQILLGCNRLNAERTRSKIKSGDIAPHAPEDLGIWRRSFHIAAAKRIGQRLKDMMAQEVEDLGDPGMALVKNEDADLQAFLDSLELGLRQEKRTYKRDREGARLGDAAGQRADLSPHNKVNPASQRELTS